MVAFVVDPKYKEILDKLEKKNNDISISNGQLGHAIYACKLILNRGNHKTAIKMFSGKLKGDFYDLPEMRQAFENAAVKKRAKIRIVAEKMGNRSFLEFAKEKGIEVRVLNQTKRELGIKDWGHFLLAKSAFRIENPHSLEKVIAEGAVNFNNPKIANVLNQVFDILVENSKVN